MEHSIHDIRNGRPPYSDLLPEFLLVLIMEAFEITSVEVFETYLLISLTNTQLERENMSFLRDEQKLIIKR
jgi:hypothetical protein